MAGGISFEEFRVDLAAMAGVISQVKAEAWAIEGAMAEIKRRFADAETAWRSPSAFTFAHLGTWFDNCQTELATVLTDMTGRLDAAYTTYQQMEQAALDNVGYTEDSPPPGPGGPDLRKADGRESPAATGPSPASPRLPSGMTAPAPRVLAEGTTRG